MGGGEEREEEMIRRRGRERVHEIERTGISCFAKLSKVLSINTIPPIRNTLPHTQHMYTAAALQIKTYIVMEFIWWQW